MKKLKTVSIVSAMLLCFSVAPTFAQVILSQDWESGIGNWWVDNGLWEVGVATLGPANAHSSPNCAGTDLDSNYPDDANTRLISPYINLPGNLSSDDKIRLKFWHWFRINESSALGYDGGYIQVSVDGGAWQQLSSFISGISPVWSQVCVDLTAYAGSTVRIAFFFQSGGVYNDNGWYIDNISIAVGPETFNNPETFEDGIGDWWSNNGLWEVGEPTSGPNGAYSGQNCVGTILGGNYSDDSDTRLISPNINLPGNLSSDDKIRLKFWHWFRINESSALGYDGGYIQVSVDGGAWQQLSSFISGISPVWSQVCVDLTAYAGSTVRIAFFFQSGGVYNDNGWYIDNISIAVGPETFNNPEDFDGGIGDWWANNGLWEIGTPTVGPSSVPSPPNCAGTVLNGNYPDNANTRLISPEIVLTPSSGGFPGLYFWHWFRINESSALGYDQGYIQVSVDGGAWVNLAGPFSGIATGWTQVFVDLNSYANQKVRIAWFFTSGGVYVDNGWYIDDVRFEGIVTEPLTISGTVTSGGSGLENVVITGLPGDPATNASGYYSGTVDHGWSGTATPTLAGYTFTPAYRDYSSVTSHQFDQDYSATVILPDDITVTSPNGGESWQEGSTYDITWTSTGSVGDVEIEYSTDNGSNWGVIVASTTNDGSEPWTVPDAESSECLIRISEAADGVPSDVSNSVFNIVTVPPEISLSTIRLNFGATTSGIKTQDQKFNIINTGGGILDWTVSVNAAWLICSPLSGVEDAVINVSVDPTSLSEGTYNALISISSISASNSPLVINVYLNIYSEGEDSAPFGVFDTPIDGITVSGSIAVTGWALDDIEVTKIEIKRDADPDDPPEAIGSDGLVLISWEKVWEDPPGVEHKQNNVVFVKGSRTDVEGLYPEYPLNDRAGWGYMMLTYGLPRQGNGTFKLYAFAEDATGHRVLLGTKQITSDNANRVQPFGTIDTPEQGESISGNYVNFGWTLTPPPKEIPTDGSTIWISIDSIFVAQPDYNHFRQDIHDSFPECLNCDGAVGFYWIDTTGYSNGVHTIGWYAVDNNGDADGFGSRFFEIQNIGGTPAPIGGTDALRYRVDTSGRLKISVEGQLWMEAEQLERIKIVLKGEGGDRFIGWGADENRSLPIGSTLDSEEGVFYWSIGPGFLNTHVLHFAVTDGASRSEPIEVIVNVVPKRFDRFPKEVKIKDKKKE